MCVWLTKGWHWRGEDLWADVWACRADCTLARGAVRITCDVQFERWVMSGIRAAIVLLCVVCPTLGLARNLAFATTSLADMRRDAVDSTNISVGPFLLWFASRVIDRHDPQSAALKTLLGELHRVRIHSFQYSSDHVYQPAALEALRSQLMAPRWHQMVRVRSQRENSSVDIYYMQTGPFVTDLVVLSAEPREFTLVSLSGKIALKDLASFSDIASRPGFGRRIDRAGPPSSEPVSPSEEGRTAQSQQAEDTN